MLRPLLQAAAVAVALVLPATPTAAQQQQPGVAPAAPFELNALEQAYLDQVLTAWEGNSNAVKTFSCPFVRYEYNAFSPAPNIHFSQEEGEVSYQQPDKGSFQIKKVSRWQSAPVEPGYQGPPKGAHVEQPDAIGEHWVCDGQAVYEYKTEQKQLHVRPIPEELRGKRIVDGPLPFLFGAEAATLKARFWMKVYPNTDPNIIQLVAIPKTQADAFDYKAVEVRLDRRTLMPTAMNIIRPDGSRSAYVFYPDRAKVNSLMEQALSALFATPRTPLGWTRVEDPQPAPQSAAQPTTPSTR